MNCDIDLKNAVECLRQGGVILYPTDTIWGIGCDATNEEAVKRVYEIKKREDNKALICLVDSANRMQRYFRHVPDVAWDLVDMATKPLTLILDDAVNIAPNLLAEDGSLAIRVTHEEFSRQLCYRFQKAIVSTSANISGETTCTTLEEIEEKFPNLDGILEGEVSFLRRSYPHQSLRCDDECAECRRGHCPES